MLVLTADHGCDLDRAADRPHARARAAAGRFAGHGGRRHDGPLADVGASVLRWLTRTRCPPTLARARSFRTSGCTRCPSCPRSRRSAASWRPHLEGRDDRARRDPRPALDAPRAARSRSPRALRGAVVERLGRAGQVPDLGAVGRPHLLMHLRMTGALLFDPAGRAAAHARAVRARRRPPARLRRPAPVRHRPPAARRRGARRVPGGAARGRAADARSSRRAPARGSRAAARAPVKSFVLDQRRIAGVGNIYADEALFRARIHPLRPAGTLTRAQLERAARRRSRRRCRPGSRPRARRSTTSATSTAPAARSRTGSWSTCARASRARAAATPDPQARRRRARDLRVRALPAAAAASAAGARRAGGC